MKFTYENDTRRKEGISFITPGIKAKDNHLSCMLKRLNPGNLEDVKLTEEKLKSHKNGILQYKENVVNRIEFALNISFFFKLLVPGFIPFDLPGRHFIV